MHVLVLVLVLMLICACACENRWGQLQVLGNFCKIHSHHSWPLSGWVTFEVWQDVSVS